MVVDNNSEHEVEKTSIFHLNLPNMGLDSHILEETEIEQGIEIPSGTALLIVKRGSNVGARFLLENPITSVGRNTDSDILLDDITVSRDHARFINNLPDAIKVVDNQSLNGTYVNKKLAKEASLSNGDEIQIGKYIFVVVIPGKDYN